jgi:O-acetylhomoserine (thiol)-lyase
MPGYADPGFDTLALHAGASPTRHRRARRAHPPDDLVRLRIQRPRGRLFNMERPGHVYSRISNPTNACSSSAWRRWKAARAPLPWPAARPRCTWPSATLMGAGSHIVASTALYGGSQNLLHYTLRRFGIETTFVKPGDIDAWRAAIRPNTKLFFGETVGNPGLDVLDIPTVSAIAHEPACRCWWTPPSPRPG